MYSWTLLPRLHLWRSNLLPSVHYRWSNILLGFFGLRPRTNVEICFWSEPQSDTSILGWRSGVLVKSHGHKHFSTYGHTVDDFFFDPSNYGYCHGMNYFSLGQMRQYKDNRSVKVNDELTLTQLIHFWIRHLRWLESWLQSLGAVRT